jgi:hypothetical protein
MARIIAERRATVSARTPKPIDSIERMLYSGCPDLCALGVNDGTPQPPLCWLEMHPAVLRGALVGMVQAPEDRHRAYWPVRCQNARLWSICLHEQQLMLWCRKLPCPTARSALVYPATYGAYRCRSWLSISS